MCAVDFEISLAECGEHSSVTLRLKLPGSALAQALASGATLALGYSDPAALTVRIVAVGDPSGTSLIPSIQPDGDGLLIEIGPLAPGAYRMLIEPARASAPPLDPLAPTETAQLAGQASQPVSEPPREPQLHDATPLRFIYGPGELLPVNGVDLTSGKYLIEIDQAAAISLARGDPDPNDLTLLHRSKQRSANEKNLGLVQGLDDRSLVDSRWALVVNADDDCALLAALAPLIRHRASEQGIALRPDALNVSPGERCGAWYLRLTSERDHSRRWNELPPVLLYRNGDTARGWLARYGVAMGPVDPRRGVPYYLAVVGRPGPLHPGDRAFIPFSFQYELDLYWGVGRICFSDLQGQHHLDGYRRYAEHLVRIESWIDSADRLAREFVYFGTQHEDDRATNLSAQELIRPLYAWHSENPKTGPGRRGVAFERRLLIESQATRSALHGLLHAVPGTRPPAVIFSATHGAGLPLGHPELVAHQGGLICQDWRGGKPRPDQYFTGDDLGREATPTVSGMVAVLLACYGGGSPAEDQFLFDKAAQRPAIAPFAFVARLPQQLLLNGALGVISHVDRAWTYSFSGYGTPAQSQNYEDLLSRIAEGRRLGFATDQFNLAQSAWAATLADELENVKFGKLIEPCYLTSLWMARNDARNFTLLGDPAARLPLT
jgi:hypothetical protein